MALKKPHFIADEARALFETLAETGGIHLCIIHPNGLAIHGKHFGAKVKDALEWAESNNNSDQGFNVYWSVNCVRPQRDKKPTKQDISHARFVHVDIDPPKNGGKFDKPEILDALAGLGAPPSFVIDSGGGLNAFWRLEDPCENLASIENINCQIRDFFDADACQNIDRVMRVPGTVNYPNARKKARGRGITQATWAETDGGECYEPHRLSAAFPEARPKTQAAMGNVEMPDEIEAITPDNLGLDQQDPLRAAITEPAGRDRSAEGLSAARLMVNRGMTDAQIFGVLLNPDNAVSAHYIDQRDSIRAASRTIALVRADGPQSPDISAPPMSATDHANLVANMRAKVAERLTPREPDETQEPRKAPAIQTSGDPEWLADLGEGGIAQFVRHVIKTAPSPQPWLTLGAAIAMFGTVAGRRYAGPTDLRTNIYSIGIADSGGGKDFPLRSVTRLLVDAGFASMVGGSKIASGTGLITAVTRQPTILFPLDEVGFLISSAADRKRAPKHAIEIIDNLTEFYSMADATFLGTAYANDKEKPREVIEQPCLSMFGVTTPGVFWGSLSSSNVLDGSLARMLIFESENDYPDAQHDIERRDMPQSLIDLVQAIADGAEGHNPFPLGEGPQQTPKPYRVPYADEAASSLAKAMRNHQIEMLREHQGSNLTGIIARMAENAAKIALVKAISDNPYRPRITVQDLDWGMKVARKSVETLMQAVKERVADTDYEVQLKYVHKCITDAGAGGLDSSSLSRQAKRVRAGVRREIISHLIDADMIRVEEMEQVEGKTGPKPLVYYDIS